MEAEDAVWGNSRCNCLLPFCRRAARPDRDGGGRKDVEATGLGDESGAPTVTDIGGGAIGCKTKEGGGAFRPDFLSGGEVSAVPAVRNTPFSTGGAFEMRDERSGVSEEVCMTAGMTNNMHGPEVSAQFHAAIIIIATRFPHR